MVEINNQRKAFLDMLAWSEGTDNGRQKTRNHGYDVIVGESCYWLLRSPSQTCHARQNSISLGAGRYSFFPVGGMPTASSLAWKTSLRKVRTLWHCNRLRSVALLPMIDRGDIRRAIDRCSNIWASLPGAGYGQFEHKADSLIANSKRAERSERLIMSRVTAIISPLWLSASSSACHGLLIITVITPYLQSPARQKCQRTEAQRATRQLLT